MEGQFEEMSKKLHGSITKLMTVALNLYQAAIYFNVCVITSVFLGSGIVCITVEQEKELKGMCEEPILMKLGLSKKFPRAVLFSRKSALGVGLMEPHTIIDVLKLKLFIGNMRKKETQRNRYNVS